MMALNHTYMHIYKHRTNKDFLFASLTLLLMLMVSIAGDTITRPSPQRLAPPSGLPCSRDQLTSFSGKVIRYARQPRQITLQIRTDEATTERFQIQISKGKNYLALFLLNGAAITKTELEKIEKKLTKKANDVRVTVWECRNSAHRIIDWRVAQ